MCGPASCSARLGVAAGLSDDSRGWYVAPRVAITHNDAHRNSVVIEWIWAGQSLADAAGGLIHRNVLPRALSHHREQLL